MTLPVKNNIDPRFTFQLPISSSAVHDKIRAWIGSPAFADLLEIYEARINLAGALGEVLTALEEFSNRWDFRRIARERGAATDDRVQHGAGAARWLSASTGLSAETETRVMRDVEALGLVRAEEPSESAYDCILVLGGARLSCKLRAIRAAEVVRAGTLARSVGLLGAARPVADTERDATDTYAPGASDEFDLAIAGAQHAFGFDATDFSEQRADHPENPHLGSVVRRYEATIGGNPLPVIAISAPSSDPTRRRANSADTITFFLEQVSVGTGGKLLLITSQIYVPYVQLEAIRTVAMPRQVQIETIGFPGDRMPELQGLSDPNHYLQEVRSTIQAARRFSLAYPPS